MCGLCGALLSEHWAEERAGARGRWLRTELVRDVLAYYGLELTDWSGSVYVLRDRKGGQAVVSDLGSVWQEAERLAGRRLDPLDPGLLAAVAHA
jgi:hypothetical protein